MKYGFTHAWAAAHILLGAVVATLGLLFGLVALVADLSFLGIGAQVPTLLAVACMVGGALLGGFLIVTGQLLQIILDQRRLLVRIHRRLEDWEETRRLDESSAERQRRRGAG